MIYSFELILLFISYNKLFDRFDLLLSCMIRLICTCPAWSAWFAWSVPLEVILPFEAKVWRFGLSHQKLAHASTTTGFFSQSLTSLFFDKPYRLIRSIPGGTHLVLQSGLVTTLHDPILEYLPTNTRGWTDHHLLRSTM